MREASSSLMLCDDCRCTHVSAGFRFVGGKLLARHLQWTGPASLSFSIACLNLTEILQYLTRPSLYDESLIYRLIRKVAICTLQPR